MELLKLRELLNLSWSKETCLPSLKKDWSLSNPSIGQSDGTALIVNDYFGGNIMRFNTLVGSHYYNLIDGEIIDLTAEQFEGVLSEYATGEEVTREQLLNNPDTKIRYITLYQLVDINLMGEKVENRRRYQMCVEQRQKEFDDSKPEKEIISDEKVSNAMKFYLLATKLKYKIRSGWDSNHWNVTSERIESIAEHVYGTCILAISLDSEFNIGANLDRVLKMLVIHEIGEVLIGDITPFDNITASEKEALEHKAMQEVLSSLFKKDELYELLLEFDSHKTKEANFAFLCDKLEADIQAKVYQDMGYQRGLDDQSSNVVFKTDLVQKMLANGANNAFDIWYEWDKSKYKNAPVFSKTLQYVKNNNTNI